jgi:hypothetical protein
MTTQSNECTQRSDSRHGFTRVELLVVVGMLTLLALMLLPALATTRSDAHLFQCRNNLRQLYLGWLAYSDDQSGALVPTAGTANPTSPQWCFGRMDISAESTNGLRIQQGLLWPYVKQLSAYKCPADPKLSFSGLPTVRSVSMNAWMNPSAAPSAEGLSAPGRVFRKQSDISAAMSPALCWVLIDENERIINDGWFVVSVNPGANNNTWIDVPAVYHNLAASLVLADGHVETRRWRDPRVITATGVFTPANPPYTDLRWLQERTTVPQ